MNQAVTIQHIGKEISDLFPGRQITRLKINMSIGEAVTAEVTELVSEEQAKGLLEVVKRYMLVEDERPRCSVCGKLSGVHAVRDAIEIEPPNDRAGNYHCFDPGSMRYGCSNHPVNPRTYWLDGMVTEDDNGREVEVHGVDGAESQSPGESRQRECNGRVNEAHDGTQTEELAKLPIAAK